MGTKVAVPEPTVVEVDARDDAVEEKVVVNLPLGPPVDDSKAIVAVEKLDVTESDNEKKPGGPMDRDRALARVETEKRMCLIKAWEDSEKSRAENKAQKKMSSIVAWENSKKAYLEAERKTVEEKLKKQHAEYLEKMKNKLALIRKSAEEKRAVVEAKKEEDLLKAKESAATYRAKGIAPKKRLGIF